MPTRRSAILVARCFTYLALVALSAAGGWAARWRQEAKEPKAAEPEGAPLGVEPELQPAEAVAPDVAPRQALFPDGLPLEGLELPAGLANISAQQCNACHFAVHDAWAESALRSAWAGATFQQALRDASEPGFCQACHLPLVNQHPLLVESFAGGDLASPQHRPNPAWEPSLQAEGVTCAACHLRAGEIIGLRQPASAPHAVRVSADLASPSFCASCHQLSWPQASFPWYDTYGEWYASPYREAGVRCQDCHMPTVAGPVTAGRFAGHVAA